MELSKSQMDEIDKSQMDEIIRRNTSKKKRVYKTESTKDILNSNTYFIEFKTYLIILLAILLLVIAYQCYRRKNMTHLPTFPLRKNENVI